MKYYLVFIFFVFHHFSLAQNIKIKKIDIVNSFTKEANVYVNPQRTELYFMSTRGGQKWNTKAYSNVNNKIYGDGDIFKSNFKNGQWTKPINLGNTINSKKGEDEPMFTFDSILIFESWNSGWVNKNGPYYKIQKNKIGIEEKVGLHPAITQFFSRTGFRATDGACISIYGNLFLFAAGKTLESNMDIYYIDITKPNSKVRALKSINTSKNERTPFLAADNSTLYFSSNGYHQKKDLDIMKTTLTKKERREIMALPFPINTEKNDYNFTINATGDWAYLIRNEDIYEVDFSNASSTIKPKSTKFLTTTIKDCFTQKTLNTNISLFTANELQYSTHNSHFQLPISDTTQKILVTKEGYDALLIINLDTIPKELCLSKTQSKIIYFDFDSYQLKQQETPSIKKYYQNNGNNYLLIGSTDYKGDKKYNLTLSKQRIKKVQQLKSTKNKVYPFPWGERYANQNEQKDTDRKVIIKKVKIIR